MRCRLKSLASRLFTQPFIQVQIKENINAPPCHWPLWGNSPMTGEFPSQRASNTENVSIRWRHHDGQWNLTSMTPHTFPFVNNSNDGTLCGLLNGVMPSSDLCTIYNVLNYKQAVHPTQEVILVLLQCIGTNNAIVHLVCSQNYVFFIGFFVCLLNADLFAKPSRNTSLTLEQLCPI